jgi:IS5 family transposase
MPLGCAAKPSEALCPAFREDNSLLAAVRAGIEKIFGHWKRVLGWRRMRYLGWAKGTLELHFKSVAWNLKRLVALCAA